MEGDPFVLIEGMTIAGLATGATQGYIYLRWEYPDAKIALDAAIAAAYAGGYLGADIQGSGKSFDLEVRLGAGAYICGEETSLLESLEGKRGQVRFKPPLPALAGLFGKPTVINNVITLASVPVILDRGAEYYRHFGMGRSRGTLPIQLTGNIKHGGLVEKAFGITLRELLYDYGGGSLSGRPIRAVQVGGPLARICPSRCSTPSWTTKRSPRSRACSGMAGSWFSTTQWTWRPKRATRWSSARSSPAGSARPAASVRRAAWKSSTGCWRAIAPKSRRRSCAICARP